ncbi:hypothetical protein O6H91_03G043400 [Diphasiastrum complanatum]|nr:hypothetical protein O6H91_03G043400 [Diphasiastrum complanatum]
MRRSSIFRAPPAFRESARVDDIAAFDPSLSMLTASTFGDVIGFWKGQRIELWEEKVGLRSRSLGCIHRHFYSNNASPGVLQSCGSSSRNSPYLNLKGCREARNENHESQSIAAVADSEKIKSFQSEIQQRTDEWQSLREGRLTASAFGNALGFWKGRRVELWEEKIGLKAAFAGNPATFWGTTQESSAVNRYKELTGNIVQPLGFKIYKEGDELHAWLGASPDGLIEGGKDSFFEKGGILEVKCPHNKGRPDLGSPWSAVPYYYMPQAQGLLEILDRDWMDFYVWTMNGSCVFRVTRDPEYWTLIHRIISEFWWGNVIPARHALSNGKETDELSVFKPAALHPWTGKVVERSQKLASRCPLVCRDIKGSIQKYIHLSSKLL